MTNLEIIRECPDCLPVGDEDFYTVCPRHQESLSLDSKYLATCPDCGYQYYPAYIGHFCSIN